MKKYTSDEFVNTKYGIYKSAQDTITRFPATIIGNGSNVSSWTIKGNMTSNSACGDKTDNLFEYYLAASISTTGTISLSTSQNLYCAPVIAGETYTLGETIDVYGFYGSQPMLNSVSIDGTRHFRSQTQEGVITIPSDTTWIACRAPAGVNVMFNIGSTPLPYEPYNKYKIPILWGNDTYHIYISEPLRKSLDSSNLYDTIESNGTLTRRVDSSGDALLTPTTEQITVPTLTTTTSALTCNIDTTLKPSEVQLTYNGWHLYNDKKYTNGEWI